MSQQAQMPQFDEATRKELGEWIEQEYVWAEVPLDSQAKAKIQASVHELTDRCWKTCITGSISAKFSKSEAGCLENCVDRFLDTSLYIVKQIEEQKSHL